MMTNSVVSSITKRLVVTAVAVVAFALTSARSEAATITEIQFQGATLACLGSPCTDPSDFESPLAIVDHLSFEGASFGPLMTDITGAAAFSLGTFLRDGENFDGGFSLAFTLQVTFLVPSAISGGQSSLITADLTGTLKGAGNSFLTMDFDNTWFAFTYANAEGEGSFEFGIPTDPAQMEKNDTSRVVMGEIRNAMFTPFNDDQPAVVPEPATMLMLGTGLSALALRLRRRQTKRSES